MERIKIRNGRLNTHEFIGITVLSILKRWDSKGDNFSKLKTKNRMSICIDRFASLLYIKGESFQLMAPFYF